MSRAKASPCPPATVSGNRASSRAGPRTRAIQATPRATTRRRGSGTTPRVASDR
ncbi:hypothetical protein [Roseiflexus sp.]|uniref:hypothetical protein n=1 Tax=Roseiflexus sp. TaxID=2562120 RepID=UPI00258F21E4|nr:hypothetical protein [Roseiflexus sp.]